ncbi:MAG: hypothetical protein U9N46_02875 [Euryarchaeota archaeon]|nr:hypothetical protein [Euryarchaeota archaeon]
MKRKKAKELHKKGWSNRKIARHLLVSKDSVGKWVRVVEGIGIHVFAVPLMHIRRCTVLP